MSVFTKNDLDDLLKCSICKHKLDEYNEPKTLACGKTICIQCVSNITKNLMNKDKRTFKCPIQTCKKEHVKPKDGFPTNDLVLQFLSLQPKEIYRGERIETLKANLNLIEENLKKIYFDIEHGDSRISEYCADLKSQIQLSTDEKLKKINESSEFLIKQIEAYEKETVECFTKKSNEKNINVELLDEITMFLSNRTVFLNNLNMNDESSINDSNEMASNYITLLEEVKENVINSVFNNRLIEFEPAKSKWRDNIIGFIRYREAKTKHSSYKELKTLTGHNDWVISLAVLDNGHLASSSGDNTIKIWDTNSSNLIRTLEGHTDGVNSLVCLNNGNLASASMDTTIILWDANRGLSLTILEGHSSYVFGLAIMNDEHLASSSGDMTIKIWNISTGLLIRTLLGHTGELYGLIVLNNGLICSGSGDSTIKYWEPKSGECTKTLKGHSNWVNGLTLLRNDQLASCSGDKKINIWDSTTGQLIKTFEGHSSSVEYLTLLPNGHLASSSYDSTIKIWDVDTGECLKTLVGHSKCVSGLAVLKNGTLASCSRDKTIKIWETN